MQQSPKTMRKDEKGGGGGGAAWSVNRQGALGSRSEVLGLRIYLEIMELDCEWLEEVVAALS